MYNASMQRTYSPEALARREARKAETKARNEAKKLAEQAAKKAAWDARAAQWEAERQAKRDGFWASLTEADAEDLNIALAKPSFEQLSDNPNDIRITNEFLHSLQTQLKDRGYLSPKQVDILVKGVRRDRELAEKAAQWENVQEGQAVEFLAYVKGIETIRDQYGTSFKIRLRSHYGRAFIIKTGREAWKAKAEEALQNEDFVQVTAKVKWVAPQAGGTVVLTSRGARFAGLVE